MLPYQDKNLSVDERVSDLLSRMTLKEKAGQLNQMFIGYMAYEYVDGKVVLKDDFKASLKEGMSGAVYGMHRISALDNGRTHGITPREGTEAVNAIQAYAVKHSRLGIPLLVSEECPKGYCAYGATVFPSPICYASAWNRELTEKIGRASGKEARAGGGHLGYGPILDICNDPRWSRMEEIYGEDPYLAGQLGRSLVKGLQNGVNLKGNESPKAGESGYSGMLNVMSTLKHFAAYGTTEGGRNTSPAHLGERELREVYLYPFKEAVEEGADSVMCSYNEIDGVPVSADEYLLTDILRGEWGFKGFVVSDALAIDELCLGNNENMKHRVAPTLADAAALALTAGVDISLWDVAYMHLEEAYNQGKVDIRVIDRAVSRILRAKFLMGLFENHITDAQRSEEILGCEEHKQLSLTASRQSVILLKNNGILPIDKNTKVAVIGPSAHNIANMLGTYTVDGDINDAVSVYDGFKKCSDSEALITYSMGCRVKDMSAKHMEEAMQIAAQSDVIVAVIGGSSKQNENIVLNANGQIDIDANRENDIDCGENIDKSSLRLSGIQTELLEKLKALGKPLIITAIQGRPYDMRWSDANGDAVLNAWYPGPFGGQAIAEIIYGMVNPSGKLTLSYPKTLGQIPVNYNHKPTAEKRYSDCDMKPLYSFGHGLSYTEFKYSDLTLAVKKENDRSQPIVHVKVRVENTGNRSGDEIVQLYVRDEWASVTRNIKDLKEFTRISLDPKEYKDVEFVLTKDAFACWNRKMEYTVEPGVFTISVGGSIENLLSEQIEIE